MSAMQIVSHPLCPHAQRLVIIGLLAGKRPGKDYDMVHIPYARLRSDVAKFSETEEIPVLKMNGVTVSSSTDHIAEFLNGVFGLRLLPEAPSERLKVRGGERLVAQALDKLRSVFSAPTVEGVEAAIVNFHGALGQIESRLEDSTDPAALTHLGYVAMAPMGSLVSQFSSLWHHVGWEKLPKVRARLAALSALPMVVESRCTNYAGEFEAFFAMTRSAFPAFEGKLKAES